MRRAAVIVALAVWVIVAFLVASLVVGAAFWGLTKLGVSFSWVSETTLNTAIAALTYLTTLALTIGVPMMVGKHITTRSEMGVKRLIAWKDIALTVPAIILYILLDVVLIGLASNISGFNVEQAQDIGFSNLFQRYEFILAFITLVLIAPLAEEALFRGYLFGKIRKRAPFWITMIVVSIVFASMHLIGVDGNDALQLQWNVAVDVFSLSLVLCALREITKNIWAGVLLHALKNGVAFYYLFIMPLLTTMGA